MVGMTGVEPARISSQVPKTCVATSYTTRPFKLEVSLYIVI